MTARADRCPGALRLHDARDGAVARVRLPGGRLEPAGLRALASLAEERGNGAVDITVRANLQLRGLAPGDGAAVAGRLGAAGLLPSITHERVRNIVASALAGRDPRAALDARPLVTALDRLLCAEPRAATLSGRFVTVVEDGSGAVAGVDHDIALVPAAMLDGGRDAGVALLLAGRDSGMRAAPDDAPALAVAAARAFVEARDRGGEGAWRLRQLPEGAAGLLGLLGGPAVPPRAWRPRPAAPGPAGRLRQADGRTALAVVPPLGRLTPAALRALASAAERGAGEVRLSVWRTVVVPDLTTPDLERVAARLEAAGLVCDAATGWLGLTACAGRQGCREALVDVRAMAQARGPARLGSAAPEHLSGCARRCGDPRIAGIAGAATEPGP